MNRFLLVSRVKAVISDWETTELNFFFVDPFKALHTFTESIVGV
eukprot:CAMPEP_0202976934 /NCGR_PEP_ID=MMETSP1396-20130829/81823_1 /ASSEMBLY_ACC=CAM_ASM_000872 /TAXON_ID= /ORGANISM="Pseudokeronopsis sp., Strain Brazil" /LENGTH=43 /DNA_ID= /DNA_START= /DNA_END= /DNA_ORIENTATION=